MISARWLSVEVDLETVSQLNDCRITKLDFLLHLSWS